jgi:hypothetical protein
MAFVVALVIMLILLVAALLATCAHLLARVIRLEVAERARQDYDNAFGVAALRVRAALPTRAAQELGITPRTGALALHVVSAGCATCRSVVDTLCAVGGRGDGDRRIVVGHEADHALMPQGCRVPILVSSALVEAVVLSGWALPVLVRVDRGEVIAIESAMDVGA